MSAEDLVRAISFKFVTGRLHKHAGTISGLEHIPSSGSFVLVPNHRSYFDHFVAESLIDAVRGTPTWFLTKQESFQKRISRTWARAWYGIPVNRDAPGPATIREVNRVLTSGDVLCVYPEGTRGPGDELLEFKPGAFRFALSQNVPIIPLGMVGTNVVLAKGDRWFKKGTIHLAFGPALPVPEQGTKQAKAQELSDLARTEIERLIKQAETNSHKPDPIALGKAGAADLDERITADLSDQGRLHPRAVKRYTRLAQLLLVASPDHPDLQAQFLRLQGLDLLNSNPLKRLIKARSLRRGAEEILKEHPSHPDANYLLGRWHLSIPNWLGADKKTAISHFETAALASPAGQTRALVGLADAYLATNDPESAAGILQRVCTETPKDHPRAAARIQKAEQKLAALAGSAVHDFALVRPPEPANNL